MLRSIIPSGALPVVAFRGAGAVVAVGATAGLARHLGAQQYGSYAFAVAMLGLATLAASRGLDQLTNRELGIAIHQDRHARAVGFLNWSNRQTMWSSLAVVLMLQGLLVWNPLAWHSDHVAASRVIVLGLPVFAAVRLVQARLQAIDQAPMGFVMEPFARNVGLFAGAFLLFVAGRDQAEDAAWIHIIALAAALVLGWTAFRRRAPALDGAGAFDPSWTGMGRTFTVVAIVGYLLAQTDLLLIGTIGTAEETGIYGVVARGAGLVWLVTGPIQQMMAPRIARTFEEAGIDAAAGVSRTATVVSLLGAMPIVGAFLLFPVPLLSLFGTEFTVGSTSLRILTLAFLASMVLGPVTVSLTMIGHERITVYLIAAGVVLGAATSYSLYGAFGVNGVAIGRLVSVLAVSIGGWIVLRRLGFRGTPWEPAVRSKP